MGRPYQFHIHYASTPTQRVNELHVAFLFFFFKYTFLLFPGKLLIKSAKPKKNEMMYENHLHYHEILAMLLVQEACLYVTTATTNVQQEVCTTPILNISAWIHVNSIFFITLYHSLKASLSLINSYSHIFPTYLYSYTYK